MRHGDKVNNLSRTAAHRSALLANLAIALIEHKRITTTLAKAKALRKYAEPLITRSKDNSTHSRRVVYSYLQNKAAIQELYGPIAEKIADRPGGYLRIIKLGFRRGDGAETALIEFVDFNENYAPNAGKVRQAKKTRRGGTPKKVAASAVAEEPAAPVVEEAVEEAVEEVAAAPVEETVETVEVAAEPVAEAVVEEAPAVEEAPEAPAAEEGAAEEPKADEEA